MKYEILSPWQIEHLFGFDQLPTKLLLVARNQKDGRMAAVIFQSSHSTYSFLVLGTLPSSGKHLNSIKEAINAANLYLRSIGLLVPKSKSIPFA